VAEERLSAQSEPAIEAVLEKLEDADREVVLAALRRAERTEAELRYLADHDSLTGLLDRRRFRAELDQYVSFSARYGGQGAVMIVDIDGLKAINDTLGHQAGDNLIRQVAETMRERVRATDIVARLSGDEFAVLMPQTDTAGALQLGEDLRSQVAEGTPALPELSVTISVGIAMFGGGRGGAEAVLAAADQAMYRAKEGGRNQIALFRDPSEPQPGSQRRQTTAARIRDALTEDRLSLHTQPIHDLASGRIERYELLLRMTSEEGELLPAARFIDAAERSGMVQELDRWVVGRALELIAQREEQGAPLSLHVNLSGASLTDVSVLEFIERRLDEGGVDPSRCTFEITETTQTQDYEAASGFADRLTDFGCQLAIDDYGAGFGPFHYLKRIPFDLIKIDGSFVRDMPRSDADQLTVQAIVQIARGLGKATIAEYVQDDETTELLREYGVDMAQGFHLGRPVGVEEAFAAAA
jgi:diguanylate cyclase (GGDEF)-like protein